MQINQMNHVTKTNAANAPAAPGQNVPATTVTNTSAAQDILELSGQTPAANNTANNQNRYRPDLNRMREIWTDHDRHVESFRRLVESLLNQQVDRANAAGISWDFNDPNAMVDIDDVTRTAAQEAIGEGGPFSVEAVATRL